MLFVLGLLQGLRSAREHRAAVGHRLARGTARRTRSRRRSGGAPSGGRAPGCGASRAGAAPPPAVTAGGVRPQARSAAPASLSWSRRSIGGGSQLSSSRITASRSSTSRSPLTYARPRPSWPGARSEWAIAWGERKRNVGPLPLRGRAGRCRPRTPRETAARAPGARSRGGGRTVSAKGHGGQGYASNTSSGRSGGHERVRAGPQPPRSSAPPRRSSACTPARA